MDDEMLAMEPGFAAAHWNRGIIHIIQGQFEDALDWLETGFTERDGWLVFLKTFPRFESLRAEPRFGDLLRRLGL